MTNSATHWFSLRRRLLILLLGGVIFSGSITLTLSYQGAHREIDDLFDAQLVQLAQTLLIMTSEFDGDEDDIPEPSGDGHKYGKSYQFQIWDNQGRLLLHSRHAPTVPLMSQTGFADIEDNHQRWRYYGQWDKNHQIRVIVGEDHGLRETLAVHIASQWLIPSLLGLLIVIIWMWFATRQGLAPITAIAQQLGQRGPERLDPLLPQTAPDEIRPLLQEMNALLSRVARSLDNERRFTADAAHELRTPLAILSTQAQVALRAQEDAQRDHALQQIITGSRRASHLVGQLLTLARLEIGDIPTLVPLRLDSLAMEIAAEWGALALAQNIQLALIAPAPVMIMGHSDLLYLLLRNVLDNAMRYTHAYTQDGRVQITVATTGEGAIIRIEDNGPGIPAEQWDNVLNPFCRLADQAIEGSGLGLSIVARIAQLHGAQLKWGEGMGTPGLAVTVMFRH